MCVCCLLIHTHIHTTFPLENQQKGLAIHEFRGRLCGRDAYIYIYICRVAGSHLWSGCAALLEQWCVWGGGGAADNSAKP